jgi:hypothetical protein
MSEINVKFGEAERSIPAPATVADAIKAFDRDVLKKALAAKVNGEEVDLNKELAGNASPQIRATASKLFATRPLTFSRLRFSTSSPERSSASDRR